MFVRDYMTRHPMMAEPDMPAVDAQRLMTEARIRRLPVVGDGKRLLGLVTRQSLLVDPGKLGSLNMWDIASYLSGLTLKDVMLKAADVVTVGPDLTIEEAARIMVEKKIGCLPVLEDGVVVGIITETDLLAQLASMMDLRCSRRARHGSDADRSSGRAGPARQCGRRQGVGHQRVGRQRLPEGSRAVGRGDQDRGCDESGNDCGPQAGPGRGDH